MLSLVVERPEDVVGRHRPTDRHHRDAGDRVRLEKRRRVEVGEPTRGEFTDDGRDGHPSFSRELTDASVHPGREIHSGAHPRIIW